MCFDCAGDIWLCINLKGYLFEISIGNNSELIGKTLSGFKKLAGEDIEMRVVLKKQILAPVAVGDTVGKVTLILDDEILHETPLSARENILRSDFFSRLRDMILMWLNSVFLPSESS